MLESGFKFIGCIHIMTLVEKIFSCFKDSNSFSLQEVYEKNPDKPQETVRARIYEKLGVKFERLAKGVYRTIDCENISAW